MFYASFVINILFAIILFYILVYFSRIEKNLTVIKKDLSLVMSVTVNGLLQQADVFISKKCRYLDRKIQPDSAMLSYIEKKKFKIAEKIKQSIVWFQTEHNVQLSISPHFLSGLVDNNDIELLNLYPKFPKDFLEEINYANKIDFKEIIPYIILIASSCKGVGEFERQIKDYGLKLLKSNMKNCIEIYNRYRPTLINQKAPISMRFPNYMEVKERYEHSFEDNDFETCFTLLAPLVTDRQKNLFMTIKANYQDYLDRVGAGLLSLDDDIQKRSVLRSQLAVAARSIFKE